MSDIGINLSLNTGSAASNVKALSGAFDSLGEAIRKALEAGNVGDAKTYGELALKLRQQMATEAKVGGSKKEVETPAMRTVHGVTTFLNRGSGNIAALGGGNAAGAALGAAGDTAGLLSSLKGVSPGAAIGGAVIGGLVALGAGANKLSEQFEKVMQPAMGLAATLGTLGTDSKKNSIAFSDALNKSAKEATKYGYTMEEGMQTVNELARLGVGSKDGESKAFASAGKVFAFERATGADRGVLTQGEALSERYGAGDALRFAAGGVVQSGMEPGQYQEYLNATLRIFEEGLSRGVVKGFGEISRTQNMLAAIGTTWKGELGAQRYSQMSSTVTKASELNSDYDVVMFQAIQATLDDAAVGGNKTAAQKAHPWDKKAIAAGAAIDVEYQKYGKASDFLAVMRAGDAGLTPEVLNHVMEIIKKDLGGGEEGASIFATMKVLNLNATAATDVYKKWSEGLLDKAFASAQDPKGTVDSPELTLLKAVNGIRLDLANAGSNVLPAKATVMSFLESLTNMIGGSKKLEADKAAAGAVVGGVFGGTYSPERSRVSGVFAKAFENKNQPDSDKDTVGDYAESAQRTQLMLQSLSPGARLKMATHPEMYGDVFASLKSITDFPAFEAAMKKRLDARRADGTQGYANPSMDYIKQLGLGTEFTDAAKNADPNALAIAGMAKDTYGNDVAAFKKSALGQYLFSEIQAKAKDGFTDGEWSGIFEGVRDRYAKPGSQAEKDSVFEQSKKARQDKLYSRLAGGSYDQMVVDPKAQKEFRLLRDLFSQYGTQLNPDENMKLFEAARSGKTGDKAPFIGLEEVLSIMAKVMRQLQSVGVNIDRYAGKLSEASKFEFYVEGN